MALFRGLRGRARVRLDDLEALELGMAEGERPVLRHPRVGAHLKDLAPEAARYW